MSPILIPISPLVPVSGAGGGQGRRMLFIAPPHSGATFQLQGRLISSPFLDSEHVYQYKAESFWKYLSSL